MLTNEFVLFLLLLKVLLVDLIIGSFKDTIPGILVVSYSAIRSNNSIVVYSP